MQKNVFGETTLHVVYKEGCFSESDERMMNLKSLNRKDFRR